MLGGKLGTENQTDSNKGARLPDDDKCKERIMQVMITANESFGQTTVTSIHFSPFGHPSVKSSSSGLVLNTQNIEFEETTYVETSTAEDDGSSDSGAKILLSASFAAAFALLAAAN